MTADRPPVSGEPRHQWTEIARRLEAEGFDGDDRRSQSARIIEVGRAIAIVREASTGAALDVPDALRKAWAFIGGITPDEWATIDKAREAQEHLDALAPLAEQEGEGR